MLFARKTYYFCCQYIPIIFVFAIILYEYIIFISLYLVNLFRTNPTEAALVFLEFHFFFILLIISYIKTCFSPPGFPPDNMNEFFPMLSEIKEKTIEMKKRQEDEKRKEFQKRKNNSDQIISIEKLESYEAIKIKKEPNQELPNLLVDELTEITFCFKCEMVKIPRAHHCRNCNRCVLRMDHHCPWTANCVGLNNHKFFVLFLFYADICLFNIFVCMSDKVYNQLFGKSVGENLTIINVLLCEMIAITFFFSLLFLLVYNIYMICKNITTIESNYDRIVDKNPFSKGSIRKNIEEVFGEDISRWLLPTKPKFRVDYQNLEHSISFYSNK